MDDLVTFLKARLNEDEAVAIAASGEEWGDVNEQQPYVVFDVAAYRKNKEMRTVGSVAGVERPEDRVHIARHDPARVLRGVEGKRSAVNEAAYWHDKVLADEPHPMPSLADRVVVARAMLCALAIEWSDHPDYNPEWVGSA